MRFSVINKKHLSILEEIKKSGGKVDSGKPNDSVLLIDGLNTFIRLGITIENLFKRPRDMQDWNHPSALSDAWSPHALGVHHKTKFLVTIVTARNCIGVANNH